MTPSAYDDGYHAGLVNDRACPLSLWSPFRSFWHLGNIAGLTVHCAIVEAIYLSEGESTE